MPAKSRSILATWKPVQHSEFLRYFAITTVVGLQPKPKIRDYLQRERFEAIHQTVLHVSNVYAKKPKEKIEPYLTADKSFPKCISSI